MYRPDRLRCQLSKTTIHVSSHRRERFLRGCKCFSCDIECVYPAIESSWHRL